MNADTYALILADCASCQAPIAAHPRKVPSIRIGPDGRPDPAGTREPICRLCFDRWNQVHRLDKGLPPVELLPGAYGPAPLEEL
jgi:hypothetical protein